MISRIQAPPSHPPAESVNAIQADNLGKSFQIFDTPMQRLKHHLLGHGKGYGRKFDALNGISFQVARGEVLGVIGRNGAGKSTLLHLVCGTLRPTTGSLKVVGRVAALLELGAGFNPEFTGRENVYINAAILGLQRREIDERLDEILAFADIGDFIEQPVKTYSSGMFMRLAFAIATSVDPDILVIDEALAVGDGAFARKSFERIMKLKESGKTILFCSHSMFQVEVLCSRAIWIDRGEIQAQGKSMDVTKAYTTFLSGLELDAEPTDLTGKVIKSDRIPVEPGKGHIVSATAAVNDHEPGRMLKVMSKRDSLRITINFQIDPNLPAPTVAIGMSDYSGKTITSAGSVFDGHRILVGADGSGSANLLFPNIPLLKGIYYITCFLATEDGLFIYDQAQSCITLDVSQTSLEQGVVALPHQWMP